MLESSLTFTTEPIQGRKKMCSGPHTLRFQTWLELWLHSQAPHPEPGTASDETPENELTHYGWKGRIGFEECCLYIMSTYIYICAIYLGWAKCACMKWSLLFTITTHPSNVHSSSLFFSTQLWSGINSWFWHTPWVSTTYCTSIDRFTPFPRHCTPQKLPVHSEWNVPIVWIWNVVFNLGKTSQKSCGGEYKQAMQSGNPLLTALYPCVH